MRYRVFVLTLAVVVSFVVGGVASAQSDCEGEVRATYGGEDDAKEPGYVDHVFRVEVRSDARCAKVDYKLTVVEKSPRGVTETKVRQFTQKVRDRESRSFAIVRPAGGSDLARRRSGAQNLSVPASAFP